MKNLHKNFIRNLIYFFIMIPFSALFLYVAKSGQLEPSDDIETVSSVDSAIIFMIVSIISGIVWFFVLLYKKQIFICDEYTNSKNTKNKNNRIKYISKFSWCFIFLTPISFIIAIVGCFLPSDMGLIVSLISLGCLFIFAGILTISLACFDQISYEKKKTELKKQQKEEKLRIESEQNKIAHNNAVANVKKEIKKEIMSIVKNIVPDIENSELRNIFNNFLNENLDKAYIWSANLFISNLYNSDKVSFIDYCKFYREELNKQKSAKQNITDAEKMVFNILEGAYSSAIFSLNYFDNDDERLLAQPIQCCNILRNLVDVDYDDIYFEEYPLLSDIASYYKEVNDFKEAIRESDSMKNFSDLNFYILLQHQLMKIRSEKVNKFSEEHSLSKLDFEDTLEFFEKNNFSEEETSKFMTMVFGKYGITTFIVEDKSLKYITDDGLSFLDLNFENIETEDYELSTAEKVENYFKKQRKKRYIERLSKGTTNKKKTTIADIDIMSGFEFEKFISRLFQKMGYKSYTTQETNDQGVDVIAEKGDVRIAIQTKCYNGVVGNSAIQEIVAGMKYYDADKAMVITNSTFTKSAVELAKKNNVQLWDRKTLIEKIDGVDNV